MEFKVAPAPRGVGPRLLARRLYVGIGDQIQISEADPTIGDRLTGCGKFERPVMVGRLTDPPHAPDIMQFERVGIANRVSGRTLHGQGLLPSFDVAFSPERCCAFGISGTIGRSGKPAVFRNNMRPAVSGAPSAFTARADAFDYNYHASILSADAATAAKCPFAKLDLI